MEETSPWIGANTDLYIHTENNFNKLVICIYMSPKNMYLKPTGCIKPTIYRFHISSSYGLSSSFWLTVQLRKHEEDLSIQTNINNPDWKWHQPLLKVTIPTDKAGYQLCKGTKRAEERRCSPYPSLKSFPCIHKARLQDRYLIKTLISFKFSVPWEQEWTHCSGKGLISKCSRDPQRIRRSRDFAWG